MAIGVFDPTAVPEGWFDETAQAAGWFDPDLLDAQAAAASADRGLASAFQTRVVGSRKHIRAVWIASMAPAVVAVVVPPSAWMQPARARRKPLKRRLQLLPALQWKYIAPTIPAATERPKLKVIRYERKLKLAPPLVIYPPPTGPPSADRALAAPFQNRTIASRRQIKVAPVYAPAATPAVVPYLPATKVIDRRDIRRTLKKAPPQPVFPLAASVAPVAALITPPRKRRKARQGLFLTGGGDTLSQAPTGTPAVYPSFVPTGFQLRKETERTLKRLVPTPVFPATPVTTSADRSLVEPFQTTRIRSRKRLTLPDVVGVGPSAPTTTPAVYASLFSPKTNRRKARASLFLGGTTAVDGYVVAQPETAWRLPKKHSTKQDRKLKREPVQPQFPATPPVPEQPEAAWRLKRATWTAQRRRLLLQDVLLEHPETPFVPPTTGTGGGGGGGGGGKIVYPARRGKHAAQLLDEALNRVVAEVMYRDLLTEPEAPAAAKVVKPFSQSKRVAIPQPEAIDWSAVEQDAERLSKLVNLYEKLQARRRRIAEDDEWMMMGD